MKFNDPRVSSYRAYRAPYPPSTQANVSWFSEIIQENYYEFDTTGVAMTVINGGGGYNDLIVTRDPYAPVHPEFQSKAPILLPVRVNLAESGIPELEARFEFDAASFGFSNPGNITVYYRQDVGQGAFTPQATDYNPATGKVRATVAMVSPYGTLGEFAFGYPDLADIPYPPLLMQVTNYPGIQTQEVIAPALAAPGTVYTANQNLPILLSWSPKGFARGYDLQVATSADFANPVVDLSGQTEAFKVWSNAAPNTTWFYRVRTLNDGGQSDWSTGSFQTIPPTIVVTVPNGGETWQRGVPNFIQWQDNIDENVVIDLYKNGVFLRNLVTNASTGAYKWQPAADLAPGSDYSIRISSVTNTAMADGSDGFFSLDVPTINTIRQNPDGALVLGWTGTSASVYVEHRQTLEPGEWQEIAGPIAGSSWTNSAQTDLSGFYRLRLQ